MTILKVSKEKRKPLFFSRAILAIALVLFCTAHSSAQIDEREELLKALHVDSMATIQSKRLPVGSDSLQVEQLTKEDSRQQQKVDSLVSRFIPGMGKITANVDSAISQYNILWSDSRNLEEMIWRLPGFFVRTLGEAGAPTQVWGFGASDSRVQLLLDSRPMNDPITENCRLEEIPLEFTDFIEMKIGGSFISAPSDVLMNVVSRSYGTVRPYTKIRYVQEPNNTLTTDALFTQNILRGANLMLGVNRQTSDGIYTNSALDVWNVRSKIRVDLSPRLNIAFSWLYHQSKRGENYGVVFPSRKSIFDPVQAEVQDENAFTKRRRHDGTMNILGNFFSDTTFRTTATLFSTSVKHEFRNPSQYINEKDIHNVNTSTRRGFFVEQQLSAWILSGTAGFQYQQVAVDSSSTLLKIKECSTAAYGELSANVFNFIAPSASYRYERRRGKTLENVQGGVEVALAPWFVLEARRSWYDRLPTIMEEYWQDTLLLRAQPLLTEHHTLTIAGGTFALSDIGKISLTAFSRSVENGVIYRSFTTPGGRTGVLLDNVPKITSEGVAGRVQLQWKWFELYSAVQYSTNKEQDTTKKILPSFIANGEVSYRNKFFKNSLETRLGVRISFYDREYGMKYVPELQMFSETGNLSLGRATVLDVFGVFNIGDAHISLTWMNAFGTQYILTPIYPMPTSMFKLGLHWEFLD